MIKRKYYKHEVNIIILVLFFISCNSTPTRLECALQLAGENRVELEKILNFYSNSPSDSLKLKAACFLIENMPGHYSYAQEYMDSFNKYYDDIDSVAALHWSGKAKEGRHELFKSVTDGRWIDYGITMDIKCVTANYLIETIEHSFKVWK